jgi:hypothetical protein
MKDEAVQHLNEAIEQDGIPVGFIVADKEGSHLSLRAQKSPGQEQAGEQASNYMNALLESSREQMETSGRNAQ